MSECEVGKRRRKDFDIFIMKPVRILEISETHCNWEKVNIRERKKIVEIKLRNEPRKPSE